MLNYELAKELKDAGFLQKEWSKDDDSFLARENGDSFEGEYDSMNDRTMLLRYFSDEYLKQMSERGLIVYRPTLSELIDACTHLTMYFGLERHSNDWRAGTLRASGANDAIFFSGKTPEEAIAKFWLALNSPSTMNK